MGRKTMIALAVGLLVVVFAVVRMVAQPSGLQEQAVDTTGKATTEATTKEQATPTPKKPTQEKTPESTPEKTEPPVEITEVEGLALEQQSFVLLNPSTVQPGSSIGITGSGFDPSTTVDFYVGRKADDVGEDSVGFIQASKDGSFGGVSIDIPGNWTPGPFVVEARQHDGAKSAQANGLVATGTPKISLAANAGPPGSVIQVSGQGFRPGERIEIYWNSLATERLGTIETDGGGGFTRQPLRIPFSAIGNNSVIFKGVESQTPVGVDFLVLSLFPTVKLSSYALKADQALRFTGDGFGPEERVIIYLNNPGSPPIAAIQANADGAFENQGGFRVPFSLKGGQTIIFIGEKSQAPTTAAFSVLPYTPVVQPSTYGGRPGTTLSFYASEFAKNEIVRGYVGRTHDSPGRMVTCFMTNDQGKGNAAGSYTIASTLPPGEATFAFVGDKSGATATTAVEVMPSEGGVDILEVQNFSCPLDEKPAPAEEAPAEEKPAAPPPAQ